MKVAECLVVSCHVLTLKHKAEHRYITIALQTVISRLYIMFTSCFSVGNGRTPLNIRRVSHLLKRASYDVSNELIFFQFSAPVLTFQLLSVLILQLNIQFFSSVKFQLTLHSSSLEFKLTPQLYWELTLFTETLASILTAISTSVIICILIAA